MNSSNGGEATVSQDVDGLILFFLWTPCKEKVVQPQEHLAIPAEAQVLRTLIVDEQSSFSSFPIFFTACLCIPDHFFLRTIILSATWIQITKTGRNKECTRFLLFDSGKIFYEIIGEETNIGFRITLLENIDTRF